MTQFDLLVRGGAVVTPDDVAVTDIAVSEGRIVDVSPEITGKASEEFDARGLHVFPGIFDVHVHFNEPGRTDWEGWETGSAACAVGGTTTVAEMPLNAQPPTLDGPSFDAKRAAAEASSFVDFALWGGLTPLNLDRMEELAARGVIGFKAFMSHSGIDDFPAADDATLLEGMQRAAALGLPVAVHAENDALTAALAATAIAEGRTGARGDIQIVASDHSPAPASMKTGDDFFQIWGGISGCQSLLASLLSAGHVERGIPLASLATVLADGPARRFRIADKGRIAAGYDADLVLVDLGDPFTLNDEDLRYRHGHSPFVGMTFAARPRRTLLRGGTVALDGRVAGAPRGRLISPAIPVPAPAPA